MESLNIINELIDTARKQIDKSFKNQIIERLTAIGITFTNDDDFLAFVKDRMTMISSAGTTRRELVLDHGTDHAITIAAWNHEFAVDFNVNNHTPTFTATFNP